MSDNVDADPQQTLEAAAVKLAQIRESMIPRKRRRHSLCGAADHS